MRGVWLFVLWVVFTLPATAQEKIVGGISHDKIGITAAFNGSEVLIYGAVKHNGPTDDASEMNIIVTLEGPSQRVVVRKKSEEMGIWINTSKVRIARAPSYYSVASTGPLDDILGRASDDTYRISVAKAIRAFVGPLEVDDTTPYTQAMINIREREGKYSTHQDAVHLVDDTLFRADFTLPANIVEGEYRTRIFLLRDGNVVDVFQTPLSVRRVGMEQWLYEMAENQAPVYGLMAVLMAVFAGWAASALFQRLRR